MVIKDISKIVLILPILAKVAQYVRDLVKMAEEEDVDDGVAHGEEKKNLVLQIVGAIYDGAVAAVGSLPLAKDAVIDFAGKIIDALVSFYNVINVFRSKSKWKEQAVKEFTEESLRKNNDLLEQKTLDFEQKLKDAGENYFSKNQ